MTPHASSWRGRIAVLTSAHVVGTLHSVSVMAMAPVIQAELAVSVAEIGFLIAGYYTAQTLCALPAGMLADRIGVARTLIIAHCLLVVGGLLFAVAGGFVSALCATATMGMGYALVNPSTAKGVLEWFTRERRASAMGFKQAGVPIGGVIAAGNGALAHWYDWRTIMASVTILTCASLIGCIWLSSTTRATQSSSGRQPLAVGLKALARDSNIRIIALANVPWNMGQASFFAFLTLTMRDAGGFSQVLAGICLAFAQVSSACGRVGFGLVSDVLLSGRRKFITVGLCAVGGVGLIAMSGVSVQNGLWLGFSLSIVLGLTIAAYPTLAQTLAVEAVPPKRAGAAMGYSLLGTSLGGALGPALFGSLAERSGGYPLPWIVSGALVLAACLVVSLRFREGGVHRESK